MDTSPPNNISDNQTPNRFNCRRRPTVFWLISIIVVVALTASGFAAGYDFGKKGYTFEPKSFKVINQANSPANVDYDLLWQALKVVNQKYIDQGNINPQKVLYGAIHGAVSAAGDQYTEFFDPEELQSFRTELRGSFEGIGAEVGKGEAGIVVVAPLDGSPAQKAGILPKDAIVKIDGQSTLDMSVDEAVKRIRGKHGTSVTLTLYRSGRNETFDLTIVRDKIEIKSVKLSVKEINNKKIAVLAISRFGDDTKAAFAKAINEIISQKADGLVLDLRNDPGGYLEVAVDVASAWLPKGKVVVTEERSQGDNLVYNSTGLNTLANLKTVVLINGGSASAAEILAGALRDHNIAQLYGEKSFGKGSVQELIDLPDKKSAVKVTVAKWITPGGKNLNKEGLHPDVEVKLTEDDIKNSRDPQLDKALQSFQ